MNSLKTSLKISSFFPVSFPFPFLLFFFFPYRSTRNLTDGDKIVIFKISFYFFIFDRPTVWKLRVKNPPSRESTDHGLMVAWNSYREKFILKIVQKGFRSSLFWSTRGDICYLENLISWISLILFQGHSVLKASGGDVLPVLCLRPCVLINEKTDLKVFDVVIPKEGWAHMAAPILLLVWHRLFENMIYEVKRLKF